MDQINQFKKMLLCNWKVITLILGLYIFLSCKPTVFLLCKVSIKIIKELLILFCDVRFKIINYIFCTKWN